jgi:hypothetical protein
MAKYSEWKSLMRIWANQEPTPLHVAASSICSIFGTLIANGERLYDPRLYHDRLLLGLTGMRSLAELHQLKQRMQAGARHKAERGELRHPHRFLSRSACSGYPMRWLQPSA